MNKPVWLSHLGVAEPGPAISQERAVAWMSERLHPQADRERFHKFAERSEVGFRHSVLDIFGEEGERFFPRGGIGAVDIGERNTAFERLAPPLAEAAVRAAGINDLSTITHVITTTCTGASAPGLEIRLAQRLGLNSTVRRMAINFMGCYAAIPALRAAWHICAAVPGARVLVVCCELSTLHLRPGPEDDALLGAVLFGDGAAAAVVQAGDAPIGLGLRFTGDASLLAPDCDDQMAWTTCADAFHLRLSPLIPRSLGATLPGLAQQLLGTAAPNTARWAIHPGGPRILATATRVLDLPDDALAPSYSELLRAGNRSSPTAIAILAQHLRFSWRGPIAMVAFGPGLTADALLLERP